MFTDSGGYQIFSLRYGSVADEIKGRRRLFRRKEGDAQRDKRDSIHRPTRTDSPVRRLDCGPSTSTVGEAVVMRRSTPRECDADQNPNLDALQSHDDWREKSRLFSCSDGDKTSGFSEESRSKDCRADEGQGGGGERGRGTLDEEIRGKEVAVAAREKEDKGASDPSLFLKLTEEGATFRSYRTGEVIHLTPEMAMKTQRQLGKISASSSPSSRTEAAYTPDPSLRDAQFFDAVLVCTYVKIDLSVLRSLYITHKREPIHRYVSRHSCPHSREFVCNCRSSAGGAREFRKR